MPTRSNPFGARANLNLPTGAVGMYRLDALAKHGLADLDRLPMTVKIMLENVLRRAASGATSESEVRQVAEWRPDQIDGGEFAFLPARVLMQDFTGVPAVVDLAAMRGAVKRLGKDPSVINPLAPVDLVIDHSVQVDAFGTTQAFRQNVDIEYDRNRERYAFLRWGQRAFRNFRVVPPGTGIVHQVNLEHLAKVVFTGAEDGAPLAYPDTLVGTDSHTTMVNGLGVLGWGVGGIEAEAVMLGQPLFLLPPVVVGFKFTGALREGVTATDLVLTVTQMLRKHGVVEKFVEFYGPGLSALPLADRATIANMCPEYGATAALFPVDAETLRYLRLTGRSSDLVELVERYCKEQTLFCTDATPEPTFSETLALDLGEVEPSIAGPRRPQDRVPLAAAPRSFAVAFPTASSSGAARGGSAVAVAPAVVDHGSVVIAAITSCTNTSNPSVMIAAGLVAKKAVERGLTVSPHVKTSLAPGSQVVVDYLSNANLLPYLEALGFHVVGFGCTTCIGNSGPLSDAVASAITENDLTVAAVLSGNRNFEGRIHPLVRAAYLASPPLVVAYALAGSVTLDLTTDPIGRDPQGQPVFLRDIWPTQQEVAEAVAAHVRPADFQRRYAEVFRGDNRWQSLPVPDGDEYQWDATSTYVQEPPFFTNLTLEAPPFQSVIDARVLVYVGDSVTTDHISPAGSIASSSPAGKYLIERGVAPADFNSYGARRGNYEVMVRGTFANIRLQNHLAGGREGNWTTYLPTGEVMSIFDAAARYQAEGTPLIVLAGKEYGTGSSRDWAAKGPNLQGIRAVIAESFERIHRSNLVGMGILPLQHLPGESGLSLGLTGRERFTLVGVEHGIGPRQRVVVRATREDGSEFSFETVARIDSLIEVDYYRHGGILPMVLRQLVERAGS